MTNSNRLYRSGTDKVFGGVAAGLGDYMNIDPVIVRILFVLLFLFGGSGILVYIILWIAIPSRSRIEELYEKAGAGEAPPENVNATTRTNTSLVAGILLIAVGLLFLANQLMPYYGIMNFWPLVLIVGGIILLKPELVKSSKNLES